MPRILSLQIIYNDSVSVVKLHHWFFLETVLVKGVHKSKIILSRANLLSCNYKVIQVVSPLLLCTCKCKNRLLKLFQQFSE